MSAEPTPPGGLNLAKLLEAKKILDAHQQDTKAEERERKALEHLRREFPCAPLPLNPHKRHKVNP